MKRYKTVDEFIINAGSKKDILILLRDLLNSTELEETVKWGAPVYTINGKNVVGLGSFKSYAGLWFFQGALLKDKDKVLFKAQEEKTKALRQWRFNSLDSIDDTLVLKYVKEAIENQKKNREIKPERGKPLVIPDELKEAFLKNNGLKESFNNFTKGKQREFAEHISDAKRTETREARLKKIILSMGNLRMT